MERCTIHLVQSLVCMYSGKELKIQMKQNGFSRINILNGNIRVIRTRDHRELLFSAMRSCMHSSWIYVLIWINFIQLEMKCFWHHPNLLLLHKVNANCTQMRHFEKWFIHEMEKKWKKKILGMNQIYTLHWSYETLLNCRTLLKCRWIIKNFHIFVESCLHENELPGCLLLITEDLFYRIISL